MQLEIKELVGVGEEKTNIPVSISSLPQPLDLITKNQKLACLFVKVFWVLVYMCVCVHV